MIFNKRRVRVMFEEGELREIEGRIRQFLVERKARAEMTAGQCTWLYCYNTIDFWRLGRLARRIDRICRKYHDPYVHNFCALTTWTVRESWYMLDITRAALDDICAAIRKRANSEPSEHDDILAQLEARALAVLGKLPDGADLLRLA